MLERTAMADGSTGARTIAGAAYPILPLKVNGLTLEAENKRLIDTIDLRLAAHMITMVMGPNGAGKSLLLRLLHGLLKPTAGDIRWGGNPITKPVRMRQAMVFQRPVLLRRSVGANIDFALKLKSDAATERRNGILEHVGLIDRVNQPARLLSGGEQQRLALARALVMEPEVLFLDEPTASLDPASVQMIEEIVLAAHARGTKIIFITHDPGQARRLADEVVFLHRGRLSEHTRASQFFTNPSSAPAQAYLDGRIVL